MAGSLSGVPLSQQFDANGKLLSGALLYIYAANTTTPQIAFQDTGLTIPHPWPVPADSKGRVPMLYLADGSVHVRLTDSAGVVQFDYPSMLVIGPSSGGGGGGGVDPTTIFQTGDVLWTDQSGIRSGWVRDNARTIGNGTSGASERAHADTQALFVFGWTSGWAVVGGAGANALADFGAGKQITLPDKRGYAPTGDTAMGNADSARLATVPFSQGNATTPGSLCGEATTVLTTPQIPAHTHAFAGDLMPTHRHTVPSQGGSFGAGATAVLQGGAISQNDNTSAVSAGTPTGTNANTGGGGAHNNTGLRVIGTFYRKL